MLTPRVSDLYCRLPACRSCPRKGPPKSLRVNEGNDRLAACHTYWPAQQKIYTSPSARCKLASKWIEPCAVHLSPEFRSPFSNLCRWCGLTTPSLFPSRG